MLNVLQGFANWSVYGVPAFLFLITVVVFFHELGHFSVARLFGVRIETFSIGFGPAIVKWKDRKGTQWKISWIPLGGYVKFFGDADGASTPDREAAASMSAADRAVAFPFKPLWQRALIVAAGPVANLVLAVAIFMGIFMFYGYAVVPPVVASFSPNSAAHDAGLKVGDRIVSIDGDSVDDFDDIHAIVAFSIGQKLRLAVDRGGHEMTFIVTPRRDVDVDPAGNKSVVGKLGIASAQIKSLVHLGPIRAAGAALGQIRLIVVTTYRGLTRSPEGLRQVSGVIGIANMSGKIAAIGLMALIQLAALLSVSIGLVNLFPIPLLDGGHLLYYACEGVLGRPLGERAQDVGFRLGLAVVLGMFLLATWNDLVRLNLF